MYILTSIVVSADETCTGMTFGQLYKTVVAAVQSTTRKPASTALLHLAVACRLRGRRNATVASVRVTFIIWLFFFSHLGVVWVVVTIVAERRLLGSGGILPFP